MTFRIAGLSRAEFEPLFGLDESALAARGVTRLVAAEGYPCRVSLADIEPGRSVLLLNHEHQPADTPFRSRHAIFVGEESSEPTLADGEIPPALRSRTLSIRAFDAAGMMTDADLVEGREAEGLIARMLTDPTVAYLHIHYARRGCYAARADRA